MNRCDTCINKEDCKGLDKEDCALKDYWLYEREEEVKDDE